MFEHALEGCRPNPLAHYLKALAVLRLVSEQKDPSACGYWKDDRFVLKTVFNREELTQFFLEEYRPSPIVAPWNGGSGFNPKDNKDALNAILGATNPRLAPYVETIRGAAAVLERLGISEKVDKGEKTDLVIACRSSLPDAALEWLDAALVLTEEGPRFPPLLGTGGNDGRLDFTNNFMQRLLDVVNVSAGEVAEGAEPLLDNALFGTLSRGLVSKAIGQFSPQHAGGANATRGFSGDSLVNSWDFVLMIEGALVFATTVTRKLETVAPGAMSFPFCVRQVGAGYASAAEQDEADSRAELWLPLWKRPASAPEVRALFGEGRVQLGRRSAATGLDFARAVSTLGTDRGIASFERIGFQVRNGLAYFAVPLGRYVVDSRNGPLLLQDIDRWLDQFRQRASSDTAPARVRSARRNLEAAIFEASQHDDVLRVQALLLALGQCEAAVAKSPRWVEEVKLEPIPPLSPDWLSRANDGSVEFHLAASLASTSMPLKQGDDPNPSLTYWLRQNLEAVELVLAGSRVRAKWAPTADREVVWNDGDPVAALGDVLQRRILRATQSGANAYPDRGVLPANLSAVNAFIAGATDDDRLGALLMSCALIDYRAARSKAWEDRNKWTPQRRVPTSAAFAVLRLCFTNVALDGTAESRTAVPIVPQLARLGAQGDSERALAGARRRLIASGLVPVDVGWVAREKMKRITAAVLFPLTDSAVRSLAKATVLNFNYDSTSTETSSP